MFIFCFLLLFHKRLPFPIPFIKKYVDDIITAIPFDQKEVILRIFNNYDNHLQFTMEVENERQIPFLDMLLIRNEEGDILSKWYQKPTSTTRYLNYRSHHTRHQLVNLTANLKNRALKLTSECFHSEVTMKIKQLLLINNYPKTLVNRILNTNITTIPRPLPNNTNNYYCTIPFISELSHKVRNTLTSHLNTNITFKQYKTVNNLFSNTKYHIDTMQRSNIIYRIPCNDCDKVYIGQTKRYLHTRLKEHKRNSVKPNLSSKCALVEHAQQEQHSFGFDDTRILATEKNLNKRLTLEMLFIQRENQSVNAQTDIQNLSTIYSGILAKHYGHLFNSL